jgi:hypothetical protein
VHGSLQIIHKLWTPTSYKFKVGISSIILLFTRARIELEINGSSLPRTGYREIERQQLKFCMTCVRDLKIPEPLESISTSHGFQQPTARNSKLESINHTSNQNEH